MPFPRNLQTISRLSVLDYITRAFAAHRLKRTVHLPTEKKDNPKATLGGSNVITILWLQHRSKFLQEFLSLVPIQVGNLDRAGPEE